MYFAYGWPKVFSTALDSPTASKGDSVNLDDAPLSEQEVVYLTSGPDVLLLVTSSGCVWQIIVSTRRLCDLRWLEHSKAPPASCAVAG